MLSCKVIITNEKGEIYKYLSTFFTTRYRQGKITPKVGRFINKKLIVAKSSDDKHIYITIHEND